jgi:hypothetical protein
MLLVIQLTSTTNQIGSKFKKFTTKFRALFPLFGQYLITIDPKTIRYGPPLANSSGVDNRRDIQGLFQYSGGKFLHRV